MPLIGFHSVMESPDSVSRVIPPITTMANIMEQQISSQRATRRSAAVGAGARSSRGIPGF